MPVVHRNSAMEDLALVVDVVGRVPHANHSVYWWSKVKQNILDRHGLKSFEATAAKPRRVQCESCTETAKELAKVKRQAKEGRTAPPMWTSRGQKPETLGLSEAEIRVLAVIAEGCTTKGAAARLNLTENTVKKHLSHIYRRLNATSGAQAVAMAIRAGLI